jgi:hypothetical protein
MVSSTQDVTGFSVPGEVDESSSVSSIETLSGTLIGTVLMAVIAWLNLPTLAFLSVFCVGSLQK